MPCRHKDYDEDVLVQELARGQSSMARIARRVGLSANYVRLIARGACRPELYERIRAARESITSETRRLGMTWARPLLLKHAQVGLAGDDETARRCREYVLNHLLGKDAPAEKHRGEPRRALSPEEMPGLTAEELEAVAKLKGGPEPEE